MAKKRITSIDKQIEMLEDTQTVLAPPKDAGVLTPKERRIFNMYAEGKAPDDWFPHEAFQLVRLAKITARLMVLQNKLYKGRQYEKVSPSGIEGRSALSMEVDAMLKQQNALQRILNLASVVGQKKYQNTQRAKRQKKVTKTVAENKGKVTLLAVPTAGG